MKIKYLLVAVWMLMSSLFVFGQKANPYVNVFPKGTIIHDNVPYNNIKLEVVEVPNGAQVTETSDDPHVVLLIRQHARRAVSEFVAGGMQRAMRPTPLPEGYDPSR